MRFRLIAAAVLCATVSTGLVLAQDKAPEKKPEASDEKPAPGKTYVPGIEQFMNVIQTEHNKLWWGVQARNWELAAYNLGEVKELLGDLQDLYPKFKSLPFADMIDAVIVGPIAEAEKAVDAKDAKKFTAAYDNLITACNSCHEATSVGFIVIQRPTLNQFSNQSFTPKKK